MNWQWLIGRTIRGKRFVRIDGESLVFEQEKREDSMLIADLMREEFEARDAFTDELRATLCNRISW